MPLSWWLPLLIVAVISWLLSIWLIYRLWRSPGRTLAKIGYSILLLVPFMGPVFFVWIRNFPESKHPELMDFFAFRSDVLDRWRSRLEQFGKLPKLEQTWRKRRRK